MRHARTTVLLPALVTAAVALAQPAAAGVITGTVRAEATGLPLGGLVVAVYRFGFPERLEATDAVGRYRAEGLPAGSYRVFVEVSEDYLGQVYPLIDCEPDACEVHSGAELIELGPSEIVSGIDFAVVRSATIEGTITDAFTGAPLSEVDLIRRFPGSSSFGQEGHTDAQGRFRIEHLLPGSYYLNTRNFQEYLDEVFDDVACGRSEGLSCPSRLGTLIGLEPGEVFVADFELEPTGTIAGSVLGAVTGQPLPAPTVELWSSAGREALHNADPEGAFEFRGLGRETYYLFAHSSSSLHVAEIYQDLPCTALPFECDPTTGTGIEVGAGETKSVHFVLDRLGRVSGRVRAAQTGAPLENVQIRAYEPGGGSIARASAVDGSYTVDGLPPGPYKLVAQVQSGNYVDQLYPDLACVSGVCDLGPGATLVAELNGHRQNVDFDFPEGGVLSGTMTAAETGEPIPRTLALFLPNGRLAEFTSADELGRYAFDGLATGSYLVTTRSFNRDLNEAYDDVPCMVETCAPEEVGDPVAVTAGATTDGIDFELDVGGAVSGRVEAPEPDGWIWVELWSEDGEFLTADRAFGEYSFSQLPAGSYRAKTFNLFLRWEDQLYDGRPCPGSACDVSEGDPVEVDLGETTGGVDFELEPFQGLPCSEEEGRICLGGGRFQVAMQWADGTGGGSGPATGVPLTDDSGYFWFFDPDNVEVLVKVLDACAEPFHQFWVFAAGLTNVATELEVLDTWTGVTYRHSTEQGPAFAPLLDTAAFATCRAPAPSAAAAEAALATLPPRLQPLAEWPSFASPVREREGSASTGPCVEEPTRLCLDGGRFAVEATWTTPDGTTGPARAMPLTSDTGTFWFFSADNLELVVKILDACGPPFERFWVFAAGLTNVEVTLQVTDLVAGETWERTNPQGLAFQPVLDTGAFDTCQ